MSIGSGGSFLSRVYQNRIGQPETDDEVSGYWVFVLGILAGTVGVILFLPSESAVGASGVTLREVSIVLMAAGLAMLLAGPTIRLPLASWVNKVSYLGVAICFVGVAWFTLVFPEGWSVLTGNQPVIYLYVVGLALIVGGGIFGSLVAGSSKRELEESQRREAALEEELTEVREERRELEAELDELRDERTELQERLERSEEETASGEAAHSEL